MSDFRILQIQLGHIAGEIALIVAVDARNLLVTRAGFFVSRRGAGIIIIVFVTRISIDAGFLELDKPLMLIGRMVDGYIQNEFDVPLVAKINQLLEIRLLTETPVDLVVVVTSYLW